MTAVSREDIELINKALLNAYCVCSAELYHNELESIRKGNAALKRITQVLEDRLKQVDYKSLAEELVSALELAHRSLVLGDYDKEEVSWKFITDVLSKYEQAIKGE